MDQVISPYERKLKHKTDKRTSQNEANKENKPSNENAEGNFDVENFGWALRRVPFPRRN